MSLGKRIRHLRQSRGMTQSQLGGTELSKSFISLLEKDRTKPSIDTLQLIARRLGASLDSLLGQSSHIPESVCEGLLALSREALESRRLEQVVRILEMAEVIAATYHAEEAAREVRLQRAEVAMEQRRFDEAWSDLEHVFAAADAAGDHWRAGRAQVLMGWVQVRRREFVDAVQRLEQALLTLRRARAGRDPARVEALIALGTAHGNLGDYAAAIRRYREAAGSELAQHKAALRGRALWGIGQAYRKMGQPVPAREYMLQAKDALEAAEELADLTRVLKTIGQLQVEQGQATDALRHFHQALRVMERLGRPVDRASTLTEIGRAYVVLGNLEEAARFASQARTEATTASDPVEVAEATVVLARISARRKEAARAVQLYEEALKIFQERKMEGKIAEVARELGLLLREQGAHAKAATYLALSLDRLSPPAHADTAETPAAIDG